MYRKYLIFVIMSFLYVALIYSLSFTVDIFAVPPDSGSLLLETFKDLDYKNLTRNHSGKANVICDYVIDKQTKFSIKDSINI